MEAQLTALRADLLQTLAFEAALKKRTKATEGRKRSRATPTVAASDSADLKSCRTAAAARVVTACCEARKRKRDQDRNDDRYSDGTLSQYARFTDMHALKAFEQFLHYVPRLVNVVTLAEALPVPGMGVALPLDLQAIASRCTGAFYAPRRFAAVQLAYTCPRARVLIFRAPHPRPRAAPRDPVFICLRVRCAQTPDDSWAQVRAPPRNVCAHTHPTCVTGCARRHRGPDGGAAGDCARAAPAGRRSQDPPQHSVVCGDQQRRRGQPPRHTQL